MKIIAILSLVLLVASCGTNITNFEECVGAGNAVMESYPAQCQANGKTFVQQVGWKNDGITLRIIPETGSVACFGCGATQCIDPLPTLEVVEETEEQHCTKNFEVTGNSVSAGMPVPGSDVPEMVVE